MDIQAEARRKSAELYAMTSKIGTENANLKAEIERIKAECDGYRAKLAETENVANLKAKCEEYRTVLRAVCALVIEIVDKYRLFEPKSDESAPKKRRGRPPKAKNLEQSNP